MVSFLLLDAPVLIIAFSPVQSKTAFYERHWVPLLPQPSIICLCLHCCCAPNLLLGYAVLLERTSTKPVSHQAIGRMFLSHVIDSEARSSFHTPQFKCNAPLWTPMWLTSMPWLGNPLKASNQTKSLRCAWPPCIIKDLLEGSLLKESLHMQQRLEFKLQAAANRNFIIAHQKPGSHFPLISPIKRERQKGWKKLKWKPPGNVSIRQHKQVSLTLLLPEPYSFKSRLACYSSKHWHIYQSALLHPFRLLTWSTRSSSTYQLCDCHDIIWIIQRERACALQGRSIGILNSLRISFKPRTCSKK